jgi:hypothetical protein
LIALLQFFINCMLNWCVSYAFTLLLLMMLFH